ncbi:MULTISPECIES: hypothetical protein [Chryseobacterium]|uniref:DUF3168 domain-containing protein n=1 Tax=Chryseobacterium camelliae TaxID=1265445 RepID=A0ABU0TLE9_9FLAO|nr:MULTISPECIES: hypothetical protein [Chryseobacterium]MDT3408524.1 hypothetical protein [Pseudacidovorax intermedius]MDQ1097621.1 hypothetical protein [Chryseobacterium camelliae]MDQ1101550.1 hypothetical protein [Chryseobacterium sp. SORGH_AS_1048]MDR6084993.1 hypothetical protein [Chryseobacterium sp. SORGH_AS_0909]MDR6129347.1 hypothetical protein [Chryseobacterium sp. SORGH_AS_1175]
MKNIHPILPDKYQDPIYKSVGNNIFENTEENIFVCTLNFDLEEGDNSQYPLEDVLEEFCLYISDFSVTDFSKQSGSMVVELAGEQEDMHRALQAIIGKRVYNTEYTGKDGRIYVKLVIE